MHNLSRKSDANSMEERAVHLERKRASSLNNATRPKIRRHLITKHRILLG
jgi:hypothetical protein